MTGKSIVTAVVSRHSHDGSRTIASQYIVADPHRNSLVGDGVDGIGAAEDSRHLFVCYTLTFSTFLGSLQISIDSSLLLGSSKLCNQFAFRSKYHEGNTEDSVGTCGEDGKLHIAVLNLEHHLGTF